MACYLTGNILISISNTESNLGQFLTQPCNLMNILTIQRCNNNPRGIHDYTDIQDDGDNVESNVANE